MDRLRGQTSVEDRLDVLRELVEYWHGPIRPGHGFAEAELGPLHLPRSLKWWYGWAGRRKEIMSGQNLLFAPTDPVHSYWQLKPEDDRLPFHLENQGVYRWRGTTHRSSTGTTRATRGSRRGSRCPST